VNAGQKYLRKILDDYSSSNLRELRRSFSLSGYSSLLFWNSNTLGRISLFACAFYGNGIDETSLLTSALSTETTRTFESNFDSEKVFNPLFSDRRDLSLLESDSDR
jgi:hypothetical protein